jgi:DNA-binding HxlR family transcriptional regulator
VAHEQALQIAPGPQPAPIAARPPVHALLELVGRRWALRVLWELRAGPLPFRRLRQACDGVSTSVLSQRLKELVEAGILEHRAWSYGLTPLGAELSDHLAGLSDWSERWAAARAADRRAS